MAGYYGLETSWLFQDTLHLDESDSDEASEGGKESGSEDAVIGALDSTGGESTGCTASISSNASEGAPLHVRALEDMLSGETVLFRDEHLDGLADFLDGCNTFGESLPSAVSSTWKFSYLEGASNQAYGDPMATISQPLKLDPSAAAVPLKAPVPAQQGPPRDPSPGLVGGCLMPPPLGGRSFAELHERELHRRARVERYRQKRRERAFTKKIRYEVRKINAEQRPRYKGRFIKQEELAALKGRGHSG